jgi:serralysin
LGGKHDDRLLGGCGDDLLSGQQGADLLDGMKGNDVMMGGGGADVFLFNGLIDEGQDEITDFEIGIDLIRVEGLTLASVIIGGDATAVISLDGKTEISLTGVAAADVNASDFDFLIT